METLSRVEDPSGEAPGQRASGTGLLEMSATRVAGSPRFKAASTKAERARMRRELGFSSPVASLETAKKLLESAAILAASERPELKKMAYRTAMILARLANFAALDVDDEVRGSGSAVALPFALEEQITLSNHTVRAGTSDVVLTDFQLEIWDALTTGADAAISAPTSTGKSFVLQTYLKVLFSRRRHLSVVYLVPTRALISQVAQDMADVMREFPDARPRVIDVPPSAASSLPARAIYVLTPERLQAILESHASFRADVVIVDEAQLLGEGARGVLLQWVLEDLLRAGNAPQLLFASPMISNLKLFSKTFDRPMLQTPQSLVPTVAQNFIKVKVVDRKVGRIESTSLGDGTFEEFSIGSLQIRRPLYNRFQRLSEIPAVLGEGRLNIVYVNGADDAELVAIELAKRQVERAPTDELIRLAQLARDTVHPSYTLVDCLLKGVGFHYSNIPPLLRTNLEQAFRDRHLNFMVCTSTLLQGVNSPAQNIFMYQPEKGANQPLSSVDFWNLSGRAGRLRKEFQGNIFLIDYGSWRKPPLAGKREVELVPALRSGIAEWGPLTEMMENGSVRPLRNRLDLESSFAKLLVEYRRGNISEALSKLGVEPTGSLASDLSRRLAEADSQITIPTTVLAKSRNVSPHKQQVLYDEIRETIRRNKAGAIAELSPLHPWEHGAYPSYRRILELCYRVILERPETSRLHRFHALVALWWMRGYPLPRIVTRRLRRDPQKDSRKVIRNTLELIEQDIRFRAVRVFTTYNALLELAYTQEGMVEGIATISSVPLYLELGASDLTMISFIELGLSRPTALELTRRANARNLPVEAAFGWLQEQAITELRLSPAMYDEVSRVLARYPGSRTGMPTGE